MLSWIIRVNQNIYIFLNITVDLIDMKIMTNDFFSFTHQMKNYTNHF